MPLSSKINEIKESIRKIDIELTGGTDIGGALVTSTNLLASGEKSKAIILITDGSDTSGSFIDDSVQNSLEYVVLNHIKVHTIGIGTGTSQTGYLEGSGLKAVYNRDILKTVAERTGGKFYEVKSSAETQAAFADIVNEAEVGPVSYEASSHLMILGFILLLVEWGLLNTRFRAIP
jgi:Ca-activated chloride channel family protein